jgi:medium-chain acyl-[acyl-carrier-protein] hydrolase
MRIISSSNASAGTKALAASVAPWLPYWRANAAAKVQLWCFPHAGGSAATFVAWRQALPRIDLRSLELPGRGTRFGEPLFFRMPPLLDVLMETVVPALVPPFAFFGHSMGATIAFELIHRLRARQLPLPVRLFVSGARAPHLPDPDASQTPPSDDDVMQTLRKLGGTPAEILEDSELREILLPMWRADLALHRAYEYRAGDPLPCPITAFGGTADPEVSAEDVSAWSSHTTTRFRSRLFSGDHFFIRDNQTVLLSEIEHDLDPWLR